MKPIADELRMCAMDHQVSRDYVRSVCGSAAAEIERLRAAVQMLIDNIETGSYESTGMAVDHAKVLLNNQLSAPASSGVIIECRCGATVSFGACCAECGTPSDH